MRHSSPDYHHHRPYASAELDVIAHALNRLSIQYQSVLKTEGLDRQVSNLQRWLEENRRHFTTAGFFPDTGNAWLADLCDSLKLAVEEKQRLEGEGGVPATKEQNDQNEELLDTIRRIENILHSDTTH